MFLSGPAGGDSKTAVRLNASRCRPRNRTGIRRRMPGRQGGMDVSIPDFPIISYALDGYIQFHVVGLGPDWMDHEEKAIQCLGHIFRCDDDKEKQLAYLEEGIPMTVKAEKVLNEYSEDQFKWFHRSEKEKYDRMKAEMHAKISDRDAKLRDMEYEMERMRKENEMLKALAEKAGQNSNLSVAENAPVLPDYLDKIHD
ncbi:hypothetical protein [Faecalibaculum rodentium]|uniref:hypothetical protein n=3 Tax=Faecalibaculum rodentium TaxID=1702221 RepID=UPI00272A0FB6|nr:hypothetical protein [Faecalibaculum rodentium]